MKELTIKIKVLQPDTISECKSMRCDKCIIFVQARDKALKHNHQLSNDFSNQCPLKKQLMKENR
jgi:hypothetical protein